MDKVEFGKWLSESDMNKKVQSDYISRLGRLERELKIDMDEQFDIDELEHVLTLFKKMGQNEDMEKYGSNNLPIGKYYMATYRNAVKQYQRFKRALKYNN